MEISLHTPLKIIYKYQQKFTALQKCILLGVCTLLVGGLWGWWAPAVTFLGSLPLGWMASRQVLSMNKLHFLPYVINTLKTVHEQSKYLINMLPFFSQCVDSSEKEGTQCKSVKPTIPEVEVKETLYFIHRDFVKSWYNLISDDDLFLDEVMLILEELSVVAMDRVKKIDVHKTIPEYVIIIRKHIIDYQEAMKHLDTQPYFRRKKDRTKEFKKVNSVVDSFMQLGKSHIAVKNNRELELIYLRTIVDAILKLILPQDLKNCNAPTELILEILTCQVVGPIVDLFTEPDFLHKVMVIVLSDEELDYGPKQTNVEFTAHTIDNGETASSLPTVSVERSEVITGVENPTVEQTSQDENTTVAKLENSSNLQSFPEETTLLTTSQPQEAIGQNTDQILVHVVEVVSDSEETSVKEPVEVEGLDTSQTMYVSNALAKQFKLSASSSDEVHVIDAHGNQNETSDVFSRPPNLNLLSDDEGASHEISFTPTFFIASDDNTSLHSNSSELSSEYSQTPEGSVRTELSRDSRSLSPAQYSREGSSETDSKTSVNKSTSDTLQRTKVSTDVTDNTHCDTSASKRINQDIPKLHVSISGQDGMKRTNSCSELLLSPSSSNQNILDIQNVGLRRVASFNTLADQRSQNTQSQLLTENISDSSTTFSNSTSLEVSQSNTMPRHLNQLIDTSPGAITDGPVEATSQDMPEDLFMNVHIYTSEKVRDPSGSVYTIYLVQYRAWHLEEDTWCLRTGNARRRYREFVTLQDRLEEHPIYKKKIRDVKGPQRWKVLPFGQIEIHGIEARRQFLEKYLQTIVLREQVGNSLAIREFLAYEGDTRIAFVKKATEVPRIDKMIARTWSGMVNKLTTRPPPKRTNSAVRRQTKVNRTPSETPAPSKDSTDGGSLEDADALMLDFTYSHSEREESVQTMENMLSHHIHVMEDADQRKSNPSHNDLSDSEGDSDDEGFKDVIEDEEVVDEVPAISDLEDLYPDNPLISTLLDLAADLVKGRFPWVLRTNVVNSLKSIAMDELERMLHVEIAELTTTEECARYINLLSTLLWPRGELDTVAIPPLNDDQKASIRKQARRCVAAFLPAILPIVVGREDFYAAVDRLMEVIDQPLLNRHLVFTLIDAALHTIFPEICTSQLQQQLLTKDTR